MIESKNFKSKQVTVQLYEFKQELKKYIRVETLHTIMLEGEDTVRKMFDRITIKRDRKDKSFLLTIKNLEGVDMEFYAILTNKKGIMRMINPLTPDRIKFKK